MSWSLFRHPGCGHPRTDDDEALAAPARRGEHPTANENRTHLLRPCAATALLNQPGLDNSRARSPAANDEAVVAGLTVLGRPAVAACSADIPGPSPRVISWPWSWQQFGSSQAHLWALKGKVAPEGSHPGSGAS